jgi:TolA-binding protein
MRAIDDAYFWTALCQFEQGQFQAAADNMEKYRKRAEPGNWMRESLYLRALSLAATGDRAAAIKELEAVEADDPEYAGYRLLIRQWRTAEVKAEQ